MEWIASFIDRVFCWVPRPWIVAPNEAGVRVTLGTHILDALPGWYVYWPLIQVFEKIETKVQVKDLRAQSVWTLDQKELCVSGAIRYRVVDARKAILDVFDYDENLQAVALGSIQKNVGGKIMDALVLDSLTEEVLKDVRAESVGWGLKIEKMYITDLGQTKNLRLLLNQSLMLTKEED